jgi:hypothetical protein
MRHLKSISSACLALFSAATLLTACNGSGLEADPSCSPLGMKKAALMQMRESDFTIGNTEDRHAFARGLLPCLAHADPDLRHKLAFEGLRTFLNEGSLDNETIDTIKDDLLQTLSSKSSDRGGFEKPYAAKTLSEIVRLDRQHPRYSAAERSAIVSTASTYLKTLDDYRSFDPAQGWRNGIIQASDLMLQLSFNRNLTRDNHKDMLDAIASQVVPNNHHFYIHNEPQKLAWPVIFIAAQQTLTQPEWELWFETLADPAPLGNWQIVFASEEGLAKLHNTKAFASAVYTSVADAKDVEMTILKQPSLNLLKALPNNF